jgi:hypothetical protein
VGPSGRTKPTCSCPPRGQSHLARRRYRGLRHIGDPNGFFGAQIPNQEYGLYVEDTWRATDRLVLDIGVRYDLVIGMAFDQSGDRVFRDLQDAARAGKLVGIQGLGDFGREMTEDKNNVAPRMGFTCDARGDGRLVPRRLRAVLRLRVHQLLRPPSRDRHTVGLRSRVLQHGLHGDQERGRDLLPGGPAAAPEPGGAEHGEQRHRRGLAAHTPALHRPGQPQLGIRLEF